MIAVYPFGHSFNYPARGAYAMGSSSLKAHGLKLKGCKVADPENTPVA